jgi:hypothetical protein
MKKTLITCSFVALGLLALYFVAYAVDLPGFIMRMHGR